MDQKYVQKIERSRATAAELQGFAKCPYDSELSLMGSGDPELRITLKIHFLPLSPRTHGPTALDAGLKPFPIREWDPGELMLFCREAIRQANAAWNDQLWLVPPYEFDRFDLPPNAPTVRPSIKCVLNCVPVAEEGKAHATVRLAALTATGVTAKYFQSNWKVWDNFDTGRSVKKAAQDPGFGGNREDIEGWTIPHEVGHILGMDHIGNHLKIRSCLAEGKGCYGDAVGLPMWMARNIMGGGHVVHPWNALPWLAVIGHHTGIPGLADGVPVNFMPAGARIPPRPIKDVPKVNPTAANSSWGGGFNVVGRY